MTAAGFLADVRVEADRVVMPMDLTMTLPIVMITLLRLSDFSVQLFKARDGASAWFFRFGPRNILRVQDDGEWAWVRGSQRCRRRIAPVVARAEAILAAEGWAAD
jgi:hypothetical protein